MHVTPWFSPGGYDISVISLMSPSHAVSALNKLLIMQEGFSDIIPEVACILILSVLYFTGGIWIYKKRHMKF
jgi:hypothetical protein